MASIQSVCVFCSASNNIPEKYFMTGYRFGANLAKRKLNLIYGAGDCGIMGAVADGTIENGGTVTGVFPRILQGLEAEHQQLTETILVDDMHSRKMQMFERADAFVILPGGFGTMDETFEVITWKQLHTHKKPIIIVNDEGYYDDWITFTNNIINRGFAAKHTQELYDVVSDIDEVFPLLD